MFNPENAECRMHDLLVHIGIWTMDLVGDEYVLYHRPNVQLWTPLYRFSIKINTKVLEKPELLPTSGRTLDLIEAFNETLNQDGTMQLEVRRSGTVMSWMYDYLAKRYYFPLSNLVQAIEKNNKGYEIPNILIKSLGIQKPITRPRSNHSSSSEESSEEDIGMMKPFNSYNYRNHRTFDNSSDDDLPDERPDPVDTRRLETVLDDVISRSPDTPLDENDNYG